MAVQAQGGPSGGERKSLRKRRCHLVVCETTGWETAAREKKITIILAVMQKWEASPYSSRAHNPCVTQNLALTPGPHPPAPSHHRTKLQPLALPTRDPTLQPARCTTLCRSKQDPKFTGRDHPMAPVPSSTCWKLNSPIKSRTPSFTAWNHYAVDEGLSLPHTLFYFF